MQKSGRTVNSFSIFVVVAGVVTLSYMLLFRPITYEAQGDYPAYLDLARQFFHMPGATDTDLSHRSPLYSIILGLFLLVFGEPHYLYALEVLQYTLVFASSLIVYRITERLTGSSSAALAAGLAGLFNLTVIFFGFMILSETLALFLFTQLVWLLLKNHLLGKRWTLLPAGLVTGMMVLTRFNMIGIPLVTVVLMTIVALAERQRPVLVDLIRNVSIFSAGVVFITGLWALHNYQTIGRFELIPKHHTGQRWAVPATINMDDVVSEEYLGVHAVFLGTRQKLLEREHPGVLRKSSLLEHDFIRKINDSFRPEVSGYFMYRDSEEQLLALYGLEKNPNGIRILNEKIGPYYEEIALQNSSEIRRFRIYSFLYSFKHISPTLPMKEPVNLNVLPSVVLKGYKLLFILVVVLTYAASVVHMIFMVSGSGRFRKGQPMLFLYGLIWYFPLSNAWANVLSDANRFRFPADMIIIGLFVILVFKAAGCLTERSRINATV